MDGGLCCPAALGSALAAAEVYLDAAKANAVRCVGRCIQCLEYPPAAALPLDHLCFPSLPEAYQVKMPAVAHWGGDDHRLGEAPLIE